jgi:hypothetical protein
MLRIGRRGDTPPQDGCCRDPPGIYIDTFENKEVPRFRYLYGYLRLLYGNLLILLLNAPGEGN